MLHNSIITYTVRRFESKLNESNGCGTSTAHLSGHISHSLISVFFISHPRLPISLLFFPAFPVKAVIIVVVGGGGSLPIGFGANLHIKLHPPGTFWFWVAMVVDAGRKGQEEGRWILKRFNAFPFLRSSAVIICAREIRQLGDVVRWRLGNEFQSVA